MIINFLQVIYHIVCCFLLLFCSYRTYFHSSVLCFIDNEAAGHGLRARGGSLAAGAADGAGGG